MPTFRGARRRASLGAAALAALLTPLAVTPASAGHISVVDITAHACPDGIERDWFEDVDPASTFALEIDCLAQHGITTGSTPTTYDPASTVTRAQMAQFVDRLATGLGAQFPGTVAGFTDLHGVSPGARSAIDRLAAADVVRGTSTSPMTYSPFAPVTRAQMAAYLNRLERALDGQALAADADYFDDDGATPLQGDIDALAQAGIVSGTGVDRVYNPGGRVTRAQMAGFMTRYLEVYLPTHLSVDLVTPTSVPRRVPIDLQYVVTNPQARSEDAVHLDWYLDSETGLLPEEVSLEIEVADGRWEPVLLQEEGPTGERGPLSYTGGWPYLALPAESTTFDLRLTVWSDAPLGDMVLLSALVHTRADGVPVTLGETFDVVTVE